MSATFGDPRLPEEFWQLAIDCRITGCWITFGHDNGAGYQKVSDGAHRRYAHRVAYVALVGPIPDGLVLDHLCRRPSCCNPAHLEPVTQDENVRRGISAIVAGRLQAAKQFCPKGHEYSIHGKNRYAQDGTFLQRRCGECDRKYAREWQRQKRERMREVGR